MAAADHEGANSYGYNDSVLFLKTYREIKVEIETVSKQLWSYQRLTVTGRIQAPTPLR